MNRDMVHAALALLFLAATTVAAEPAYKPQVGQDGKDVIWVPTPEKAVERMLKMAQVGPEDFVIDLGSGDGRIVIMAAQRFGARGFGVDLNPDLVKLSDQRAKQAGVSDRAKFYVRDIFRTDLRQATVVTLYLLNELNMRLRPTLLKLAPGTRIVANAFDMGEWEPDEFDASTQSSLRLWIVPAQVAGTWVWALPSPQSARQFELDMNQQFQRISGVVKVGQQRLRLRDARLNGAALSFALLEQQRADYGVRYDFKGRVRADRIEGEVTSSEDPRPVRWVAKRRGFGSGSTRS